MTNTLGENTNSIDDFLEKINDDSYIQWLEYFSTMAPAFSNNCMPKHKLLKCTDIRNAKLLKFLYQEMIKLIESKYNIPMMLNYGGFCILKYNNSYYLIGYNGKDYSCQKMNKFKLPNYIEYDELRNYIQNKYKVKTLVKQNIR